MRLSTKSSFMRFIYTHAFFTMISFFFGTFHTLYNFCTPIRISSRALCRTALTRARSRSVSLCFVLLPRNFSTLVPGLPQHSFGAFLSVSLCPSNFCSLSNCLCLSAFACVLATPEKWCQPLAYFQSKRLFCRPTVAPRANLWQNLCQGSS